MINRFPHAGEALGATPGHPLLIPALSQSLALSMSRQQALLSSSPSGILEATNVQAALEEQSRTVASLNTYRANAFGGF